MLRRGTPGPDDRGAVAVVVALVLTFVLVPVAALAVDLGSRYTRTAAAQRAADDAATAGAEVLAGQQRWGASPAAAIQAAAAAAIGVLCHDPTLAPSGSAGTWHDPCADPAHAWAFDRDADPSGGAGHPDGEIEFYVGSPSASTGTFAPGQRTDGGIAALVSGIRVVTPPATIRYGFAGIFGRTEDSVQRAATAQLLSVLPARDYNPDTGQGANSRLYLTQADLVPQTGGRPTAWCARSGPRESWRLSGSTESNHPTGVCDPLTHPSVPRGLLATAAASVPPWTGTVGLEHQLWPDVSRLRQLTGTLFGSGGRLVRPGCPGGNSASTGGYSGVESGYLGDFVNPRVGSATGLKALLTSGAAPTRGQEGWLSPDVLRCGRLAVVPVLRNVLVPPQLGLGSGPYPVDRVRLLWLDGVFSSGDTTPIAGTTSVGGQKCLQRGFYWENAYDAGVCPARDETNAPLRAITGYPVDPRLLPATVSGAAAANTLHYVGSGLPATVRLVRDPSDPPAT